MIELNFQSNKHKAYEGQIKFNKNSIRVGASYNDDIFLKGVEKDHSFSLSVDEQSRLILRSDEMKFFVNGMLSYKYKILKVKDLVCFNDYEMTILSYENTIIQTFEDFKQKVLNEEPDFLNILQNQND